MPAGSISANGSRIARWTIGTLALLLLVYAVVRAYTVSFSYDETFTFMEHVRKGVFYTAGLRSDGRQSPPAECMGHVGMHEALRNE